MCKAVDKDIQINNIPLLHNTAEQVVNFLHQAGLKKKGSVFLIVRS